MNCPSCGARNPASAAWCSLCYAQLGAAPDAEEEASAPGHAAAPDPGPPPTLAGPDDDATPTVTTDGRFRRTDEGLDWRCAACGTWNPIERRTCSSCGAAFARTVTPDEPDQVGADVSETVVVGASLAFPGAGHVLLGRTGAGVLRMILYVTWLLGGVLLLRAAAGSGQPVLPALPLLLGALVVLVASVVEAQRTATGHETVLLNPRVTLWLVVAVLGALMLSFLAAALSVGR